MTCTRCGATPRAGLTCRDAFNQLLAFEFADREAFGPVHHLTVACYYLQHPDGYSDDVRAVWRRLISAPEAGREFAVSTMAATRDQFEGAARVREPGREPPEWWPRHWTHTALDALAVDEADRTAAGHVRRVRAWAVSVRTALDTAEEHAHSLMTHAFPEIRSTD